MGPGRLDLEDTKQRGGPVVARCSSDSFYLARQNHWDRTLVPFGRDTAYWTGRTEISCGGRIVCCNDLASMAEFWELYQNYYTEANTRPTHGVTTKGAADALIREKRYLEYTGPFRSPTVVVAIRCNARKIEACTRIYIRTGTLGFRHCTGNRSPPHRLRVSACVDFGPSLDIATDSQRKINSCGLSNQYSFCSVGTYC